MQTRNRIFDDVARVASGAASSLTGIKAEIEGAVRAQVERLMGDQGLVSREEFEAVQAMAAKARTEQEQLLKRIEALEAKGGKAPQAKAQARPKARKTAKTGR